MLSFSWPEVIIVSGSVLFLLLLSIELLSWSHIFTQSSPIEKCRSFAFPFGYSLHDGPHTWKARYPKSTGYNQSPINITTKRAIVVEEYDDIEWNGYNRIPCSMIMANDGNSVTVCGTWCGPSLPSIQGGPLIDIYNFHSMRFHWGPSDSEGSEHTIDLVRYAMELQLIHVKRTIYSPFEAICLDAKDGLVIVSIFFEIIATDNPYLDYVITNLRYIKRPGSEIRIPPFPLSWIYSNSRHGFYAYHGSLTQPPCNEIVTWLIDNVPRGISTSQIQQFRRLLSKDGSLLTNCRPVQYLNEREVYLYA